MKELSSASAHISSNSQSVVNSSKSAFNESKRGREAIETMKDKIDEIKANNEDNGAGIVQLKKNQKKSRALWKLLTTSPIKQK